MSTETEATGLAQCFIDEIAKLPSDRDSEWIRTEDAAKAAGVDEDSLKLVLRRTRFKVALAEAGIRCSFRGKFLYVSRESSGTSAD